ncbi:MAG: 4Fe-4S binding protein [Promethearchaeota archaeon]
MVHNTIFDNGYESSVFICNYCSCHCGALFPAKLFHEKGAIPSNFSPKFDIELCTKCETCMRKCPGNAIYHRYAIETDLVERMVLREKLCIGCGICAVNCLNDAIKMVKIRDKRTPEKTMIGDKTFLELLQ